MIATIVSVILIYICDINGQTTTQLFSLRQPTDIRFEALKQELRHPADHRNPHSKQLNSKTPSNVLTIYKWFDNGKTADDQPIFAPGASKFVQLSQSVKRETNTVKAQISSENKSIMRPFQFSTVQSPETTSKSDTAPGLDLLEINPYYQVHNSPFIGQPPYKESTNIPSVQSTSIADIIVRNQIFQNPLKAVNRKFGWNANLERQKFLNEVEKLRSTNNMKQPRNNIKTNSDNSLTKLLSGLLPTQELIKPSLTGPAQEDKLLMDMLTQGLHPLQEIVVDKPKKRTSSEGIMEEGRSEVPGLHSLQAYTIPDATDIVPHSDLTTPIESNTFQADRNNFIQSLNRLRQRFTFGNPQGNKVSLFATNGNRDRGISVDNKSVSTEGFSSPQVREPIRRMNLSATASFTEAQVSEMLPQTANGFGLRHGIKNHPNILDFFSKSKPRLNLVTAEKNIQEHDKNISMPSQLPQPRTRRKSESIFSTINTSSPTHNKPMGWNTNIPQTVHMSSPRTQRQLRDNFVVDVINLPALEVTLRYLPVGSVSKNYVKIVNSQFPGAKLFNHAGTNIAQTRVVVPWVSNIIIPSVSVNSITEKNIRETSSYVNTQGRLVDKVTETSTRHNLNITQHYNPLMPGQFVSPDQILQKHSAYSFPLVISRSRSVPTPISNSRILEWTRGRQDANAHPSRERSVIRQSLKQPNKPELRKRQRSRSSRFFMPMQIKV